MTQFFFPFGDLPFLPCFAYGMNDVTKYKYLPRGGISKEKLRSQLVRQNFERTLIVWNVWIIHTLRYPQCTQKSEHLKQNTLSTHFMKWVDLTPFCVYTLPHNFAFSNPPFPHAILDELATPLFPQFWRYNKLNLTTSDFWKILAPYIRSIREIKQFKPFWFLPRISNGTNSPGLALLKCQNF